MYMCVCVYTVSTCTYIQYVHVSVCMCDGVFITSLCTVFAICGVLNVTNASLEEYTIHN